MLRSPTHFWPFCWPLAWLLVLLVPVGADEALPDSPAGILLLRNGELILGRITRSGDHYDVVQSDGEIHVRAAEVEAVCRDLPECCRVKQAHVSRSDVNDYLALAEWCLRNGLLAEAGSSLQSARALDPAHPKLSLLERRCKLAAEQPASTTASAPVASSQPSGEELDRTVRALPPRAVEQFTMQIQPLLLNHCSMAGCHGPQSGTSFHLLRLPNNRTSSRRSTQRNLYAALALVDRAEPGNSRLLTMPAAPHGTAKTPIFNKHEANHYRRLVEWAYLVSSQAPEPAAEEEIPTAAKPPARLPAGMEAARPLARRKGGESTAGGKAGGRAEKRAATAEAAAAAAEPEEASDVVPAAAEFPTNAVSPAAMARKPVKRGATIEQFVPKDEFDPEIFNRQQ